MKRVLIAVAALAAMETSSLAAMSEADCRAAWATADANKNGTLEANESARYSAMLRVANKPLPANTPFNEAVFLDNCKAGAFELAKTDPGAPLKGANSFTEGQAQDWVVSSGFTNVSALKKDDDGIWRGTAQKDGKTTNVAVDYKGNVVASN